jgi:SAM-dependent methyltransferase
MTQPSNTLLVDRLAAILPGPVVGAGSSLTYAGGNVPVIDGVVRFRQDSGYNTTFALQWHRFRTEQLDDVNGSQESMTRFRETDWSVAELAGKRVLEAGAGAGRFTRILGSSGATLYSFDYSAAIDANHQNNAEIGNITFMQADILNMPFAHGRFDYVFCHGVLQHTPDPKGGFMALTRMLAPGGKISVDVYRKDGLIRPWKAKYLWRPVTTRMPPERLLRFLEWFIPKWLPFDTAIKKIPYLGNYLGSVIPCWNYWNRQLSDEQKIKWAIMDTFDALAPPYDLPATIDDVRAWFHEAGLVDVVVRPGGNGVVGNGRAPETRDIP